MLTGAFARRASARGPPAARCSAWPSACWRRCRWRCCRPGSAITLRANQIVTGIGINILVLGATTLAYREIFGGRSRTEIPGLSKVAPPGLGDMPVFGEAVFRQVWLLYAGADADRARGLGAAPHRARPGAACGGRRAAGGRQVGPVGDRACATARCCSPACCRRSAAASCRSATSTPSPKA